MALTKISTDGVKDDAVTAGKIPANAVGSSELADNAVDTAAIANDAVTDAKLANSINSAIAANTAKVQTTINNNADNRLITGSGTANTLNGEANLTYDGNSFISTQTTSSSDSKVIIRNSNTPASGVLRLEFHHGTGSTEGTDRFRYGFIEGFRQSGSNDGGLVFGTKPSNAGAPAERMRIDSSGRLLVNTTSGHGKLQVHDGSIVHSKPAGGGTRNWKFVNNNTAVGDYGIQISTTEAGSTYVNHTELKAGGDVHIHDGNLVVASGHGIDFSADGNASGMSSEVLKDYEEGSWTPGFYPQSSAMTLNYDLRIGSYVKIGRVVYWQFRMRLSSLSGNGNQVLGLSGLPYTVDSGQPQVSANIWGYSWSGEVPIAVFYHGGTTRAEFYYYSSSQTWNASYASDLNGNSSYTAGSGFYFVA